MWVRCFTWITKYTRLYSMLIQGQNLTVLLHLPAWLPKITISITHQKFPGSSNWLIHEIFKSLVACLATVLNFFRGSGQIFVVLGYWASVKFVLCGTKSSIEQRLIFVFKCIVQTIRHVSKLLLKKKTIKQQSAITNYEIC